MTITETDPEAAAKAERAAAAADWVRLVAAKLGVTSLSQTDYNESRPYDAPSARTIIRHAGSWVAACKAAGLGAGMPSPVKWTPESLIHALRTAAKDIGGQAMSEPLTAAKYGRWRLNQPDPYEWPSLAQFVGRTRQAGSEWVSWCAQAGVTPAVKRRTLKFTNEEMQGALRRCAASRPPGERGEPLTEAAYIAWASARPDEKLPHHRTFSLRYGTWRKAIEAAGLPSTPRSNEVLMDTTDAIKEAATELGASPRSPLSAVAYDAWANGHPSRPSLSTVIRDHLSWRNALRAAKIERAPRTRRQAQREAKTAVPA